LNGEILSLPDNVIQQLQKLVQDNVNKYFSSLKPAEKTPDKVKFFAQKQLDFFVNGIVKEMPELRIKWAKGHPFHAHLRLNPQTRFYDIQVSTDEE
jgi:hypothetical protein